MFADLLFARPVMQISDVDQGKGQPGHVCGFGVRAIGEEDHDMLGGIFLAQTPQHRHGFDHPATQEGDAAGHGQAHYFLPQFVARQIVVGDQQGLGVDMRQPGLNDLTMNEAIVDAKLEHF